jgi:hypothetical protein
MEPSHPATEECNGGPVVANIGGIAEPQAFVPLRLENVPYQKSNSNKLYKDILQRIQRQQEVDK